MFHRYQYEAQFYPTLSRVPLDVRRKLDICGIKLSLKDWQRFSLEERVTLCHLPCETVEEIEVTIRYIDFLSRRYCDRPIEKVAPLDDILWNAAVPKPVIERSAALKIVTEKEWRELPSHHRYALFKTAVSEKQPEAFEQVLNQVRHDKT
jgi:hypothetical protein